MSKPAALIAFVLLIALLTSTSEFHSENLRGPQIRNTTELHDTTNSTPQALKDLPAPERASLGAAMHEARYAVWRADGNASRGSVAAGEVLHADNPAQQYRTEFEADAVRVSSTARGKAGEPSWTLALRLESYGSTRQVTPPAALRTAVGRRVEYQRGDITEWYENTDDGLEQGFTIARPPTGTGIEHENQLEVRVAVESNLTPQANAAGSRIEFYSSPGVRVATYGKLKVIDALGKELPARMELAQAHQVASLKSQASIIISVDTTGAHYPITIDPLISTETKVTAADGAASDQFGNSVALAGDTAVVGANLADVGTNTWQGAAYVFVRSGTNWSEQAKLTAADGAMDDYFGHSVSIDGDTVVVGAYLADVSLYINQGAAYVFVRSGSIWSEQAKLTATDAGAWAIFGDSVSLSGDTAVVGASQAYVGGSIRLGAAYVFTRSGTTWNQQTRLTAADGAANDKFGALVSLDGDTAVVGAYNADVGANADQGAAYVFTRSGTSWSEQAKLIAGDGAADDGFGSVSLDGDTVVVGAISADVGANLDQGAAYVFTRSGTSWSQQAKLTAADGAAGDNLGISVALDGDTAVVGARGVKFGLSFNQGAAYVFTRSGTSWGQWPRLAAADGDTSDHFGSSVAFNGDTAVVGAFNARVGSNSGQGAAYFFFLLGGGGSVTITESGGSTSVTEVGATDTYTIVLDTQPTADVTITVSPDTQTTVSRTSLTFTSLNWDAAQTVTASAVDDLVAEGDHTSTITHSANSLDSEYSGLPISNVVATITDNDVAGVTITESLSMTDVVEGGATDTYTIILDTQPTADVTITVSPDTQTTVSPTSLTFTSLNWNAAQTVTVSPVDDLVAEGNHTSTIAHSASSGDPFYDAIAIANVVASITDNDLAGVSITETGEATDVFEIGPTSDTYTVALTSEPTADVTITISPDTQATVSPTSMIFTSSNWSTPQTVTVTAVDDNIDEASPHLSTITHAVSSTDAGYSAVAIVNVVASITDNDTAGVTITESGSSTNVVESGLPDSYDIALTSEPTGDVTISISSDGQTAISPAALTFTPANWMTPQTVIVTAVADAVAEGLHASTITHVAASADPLYDSATAAFTIPDVVATVSDTEVTITASLPNAAEGGAATSGAAGEFTITRSAPPTGDLEVTLLVFGTATEDADYVALGPTVTIPDGQLSLAILVTPINDMEVEGPETVTVLLSDGTAYTVGSPNIATVTIADDELPVVTITLTDVDADESGNSATLLIFRNGPTTADLVVNLVITGTATEGVDFAAIGTTIVIPAGQFSVAVAVSPLDDDDAEGPETVTVTIASSPGYEIGSPSSVTVTITDDEIGLAGGGGCGGCEVPATGTGKSLHFSAIFGMLLPYLFLLVCAWLIRRHLRRALSIHEISVVRKYPLIP